MPRCEIWWQPGRTPEQEKEIATRITEAISDVVKVPEGHVKVIFRETPPEHYFSGGVRQNGEDG